MLKETVNETIKEERLSAEEYIDFLKRTGKQKPEPPSPFSFAKEYRQR